MNAGIVGRRSSTVSILRQSPTYWTLSVVLWVEGKHWCLLTKPQSARAGFKPMTPQQQAHWLQLLQLHFPLISELKSKQTKYEGFHLNTFTESINQRTLWPAGLWFVSRLMLTAVLRGGKNTAVRLRWRKEKSQMLRHLNMGDTQSI